MNRQWRAVKGKQAQWQQILDRRWRLLCDNDPDVVLQTWQKRSKTTRPHPRRRF
jgi:hypothetical protein